MSTLNTHHRRNRLMLPPPATKSIIHSAAARRRPLSRHRWQPPFPPELASVCTSGLPGQPDRRLGLGRRAGRNKFRKPNRRHNRLPVVSRVPWVQTQYRPLASRSHNERESERARQTTPRSVHRLPPRAR